jgi:hypothetical protein
MAAKKKENEDRLENLEHETTESMKVYEEGLIQKKDKHATDISRLELDQREKISADEARKEELEAEMTQQGSKFEQCSA